MPSTPPSQSQVEPLTTPVHCLVWSLRRLCANAGLDDVHTPISSTVSDRLKYKEAHCTLHMAVPTKSNLTVSICANRTSRRRKIEDGGKTAARGERKTSRKTCRKRGRR